MHIVIITQEDPFYLPVFFATLIRRQEECVSSGDFRIDRVVIQPSFRESSMRLAKRLYRLYGPADFLRLLARYAAAKIRSLASGFGLTKQPGSVADHCRRAGIPVELCEDVNAEEFVDAVRRAGIDLVVSVSAPQLFKAPLLNAPSLGCINIHNGRLPDYRGMLPNFWQMLNGESHATTTIHVMAEKLDRGAILRESTTPIEPGMSLDSLIRRTKRQSALDAFALLQETARVWALPPPVREVGDAGGTYYSFPTAREARQLRQMGYSLL